MKTPDEIAAEIKAAAKPVTEKFDADIIFFSGAIYAERDQELLWLMCEKKSRDNVLLCLTTNGGSPDAAYKMARCIQRIYAGGTFTIFVDSECKSAGTLLALGADQLVMWETAELGPLDVQVWSKEEVGELSSGLTPAQALTTLRYEANLFFEESFRRLRKFPLRFSTRVAAQIASRMSIGLFSPIYQQIDPMRLGEIQRAMLIGGEYGQRVASKNVKENAVAKLISGYPSHGFVIDHLEARELFERVIVPDVEALKLSIALMPWVEEGRKLDRKEGGAKIEYVSEPKPAQGAEHEQTGGTDRTGEAASRPAGTAPVGSGGTGDNGEAGAPSDPGGGAPGVHRPAVRKAVPKLNH